MLYDIKAHISPYRNSSRTCKQSSRFRRLRRKHNHPYLLSVSWQKRKHSCLLSRDHDKTHKHLHLSQTSDQTRYPRRSSDGPAKHQSSLQSCWLYSCLNSGKTSSVPLDGDILLHAPTTPASQASWERIFNGLFHNFCVGKPKNSTVCVSSYSKS